MKIRIVFITLLLFALVLLSGCSLNIKGEGKGFVYEAHGGKFTCSHTPYSTDIKVDKEAVEIAKKLVPFVTSGQMTDEQAKLFTHMLQLQAQKGKFPKLKELVKNCQQLIKGKTIT